jgi:2-methylcitrate dehydratase
MTPHRGAAAQRLDDPRTRTERLASFVSRASWGDISPAASEALRIRVLDSLGCAYGAISGEPVRMLRKLVDEFGGKPLCTLIGGGRSAPDRAAFYNGTLVRYLDYNDSYLARGETCHPSDSLGAVLAAAEYAGISGKEFLTALAVAYQVQCRLSEAAPVRAHGFDHVTHGAIAAAAGAAKALRLDLQQIVNAVAIAGTANNALRVTRTGELSHWKGLAAPNAGAAGLQAAFLAMRGITGPREMFEGVKGWMEVVSGPFEIDWEEENLERVTRTILKKYNAEIHSQSAIEGMIGLMAGGGFTATDIERIRVDIFDVAHLIIGGGAEGDKMVAHTKEEADHSLPYIVAAAALDGEVTPAQYTPERIKRDDVQRLMRRVDVFPDPGFSIRFPEEHACRLTVTLGDGRVLTREMSGYEGFHTRPMSWGGAVRKFHSVAGEHRFRLPMGSIVKAVGHLEKISVRELAMRLG